MHKQVAIALADPVFDPVFDPDQQIRSGRSAANSSGA